MSREKNFNNLKYKVDTLTGVRHRWLPFEISYVRDYFHDSLKEELTYYFISIMIIFLFMLLWKPQKVKTINKYGVVKKKVCYSKTLKYSFFITTILYLAIIIYYNK
jgi:hypothetical protein